MYPRPPPELPRKNPHELGPEVCWTISFSISCNYTMILLHLEKTSWLQEPVGRSIDQYSGPSNKHTATTEIDCQPCQPLIHHRCGISTWSLNEYRRRQLQYNQDALVRISVYPDDS